MRDEDWGWVLAIGAVIAAVAAGATWAGWTLAAEFSGAPATPGGPVITARALVDGDATWPAAASWWTGAVLVAVLGGGGAVLARILRRPRVDRAARRLPRAGLARYVGGRGPVIGRVVGGRRSVVRMTTEDQAVVIAGPRAGKTTALAIPAALDHDGGPLVVTSNKRDLYDTIGRSRREQGTVWLLDPQQIAGGEPRWFWNPLTMAASLRGARRLARIWAQAGRTPGAKTDRYFDGEGEELLAGFLLAAAVGEAPLTAVYAWLQNPDNPAPADLLRDDPSAAMVVLGLDGRRSLPEKQRAGVFASAAAAMAWLADPALRAWTEAGEGRREFRPAAFVESTETLVLLSREGEGSAEPLVTALTAAVLEGAEAVARTQEGGRLGRPLLGVLDEVANVCRWRELPDLYSHYGSRGIVLMAFAQSWAQLVEAFGREGAEKLWSAANVRVYAGGVSDTTWLKGLSALAGEYDARTVSTSTGRQGPSRSRATQRRAIYDVAALASMPPGRALVILSAADPVLIELSPWWSGRLKGKGDAGAVVPQAALEATP